MNRKVGVILSYVLMVIEALSTLLLTPYIIHCLGMEEYGVYKLSASVVAFLFLLDMGVGNSVIRFMAKYRALDDLTQSRQFLGVTTIYYLGIALLTLIVGAVLVLLYPAAFAEGLSPEEIELGQKLLCITILNAAVSMGGSPYGNAILAYERFAFARLFAIAMILLRIAFIYIVLRLDWGSMGIVWTYFFVTIASKAASVWYVTVRINLTPQFTGIKLSFIREIAIYSGWVFLQMIATQLNAGVAQLLLGMLVPAAVVMIGIYSIGLQVVQYFQCIGGAFNGVLMPGLVKLVENQASAVRLTDEMIRIGRIIFMSLAIICICFLLFGEQFIMLWVGPENSQAYLVTVPMMFAYLPILTEAMGTQILWAKNQHKEQALLKIIIVALNIGLTTLLIQWHPLLGATFGTCLSLFLGDIVIMNVIFKKKMGIQLIRYYKGIFHGTLPCIAVTLLIGLLLKMTGLTGWVGFLLNVTGMNLSYILLMWLFGLNASEKNLLKNMMKKSA